jgi:CRISPR-associated protein (TIGR03986 family)
VVTVLRGEEWQGKTGAELESLLDERLPRHDRFVPGRRSGHFDVKLTTRSLLYIRAALKAAEFQNDETRKYADGEPVPETPEFRRLVKNISRFFSTWDDDQPVIPGSSLRGMLRTLVEIVGYGKVQWVTDKKMLYRAVGDPSAIGDHYRDQVLGAPLASPSSTLVLNYPSPTIRGGYLTPLGRGWAIQPAISPPAVGGETFAHVDYTLIPSSILVNVQASYPVYIAPASRASSARPGLRSGRTLVLHLAETTTRLSLTPGPGLVPARLIVSGHMGGQHPKHWHCAIYEPDQTAAPIPIPDTLWEAYRQDLDSHTQSRPRSLGNGDPLFYLTDGSGHLVFFGHTMMFRLPYANSPLDLVPSELRRPKDVDLAEALFGFVRTRQDLDSMREHYGEPRQGSRLRAYKGRVTVSSATLDPPNQTDLYSGTQDLALLSGPKATCFQHYLVQNDERRKKLKHYDSSIMETAIRGHKLYWRKGNVAPINIGPLAGSPGCEVNGHAEDRSTQHTQANPVNRGKTFSFRVDFANLTDEELGALCWVLEPVGLSGKEYAHSLGMGRPLGMGAVGFTPVLHLIDRTDRYKKLFDDGGGWHTESSFGNMSNYKGAFEKWVLRELEKPALNHLNELDRIKCLLALMEWPERPYSQEAENPELAEFRDRKVLPPPIPIPNDAVPDGDPAELTPNPALSRPVQPPILWKTVLVGYQQGTLGIFGGKGGKEFIALGTALSKDQQAKLTETLKEAKKKKRAVTADVEVRKDDREKHVVAVKSWQMEN